MSFRRTECCSRSHVTLDAMVDTLKAAAESSRLRILALLSRGDLTVSDLTEILNQSQPRVSRHLKLLLEAGLIGRYQEGSWAFFRLSDDDAAREFVQRAGRPRRMTATRRSSATSSGSARSSASGRRGRPTTSRANAASWDEIRSLHASDRAVEAALLQARRQAAVPVDARSRHRHRPAARTVRAALPARRRHRHVARDAGGRARQSRQGRRRAMRRCGRATSTRRRSSATPSTSSPSTRCCTISTIRSAAIREAARLLRPGRPADHRRFRAACAGVPARGARACAARLFRPADRRMVRRGRPRSRGQPGISSRAPAPSRR